MPFVQLYESKESNARLTDSFAFVDDLVFDQVSNWRWYSLAYHGPLRHCRHKTFVGRLRFDAESLKPIHYLLHYQVLFFAGFNPRFPVWHLNDDITKNNFSNLTTRRLKAKIGGEYPYQGVSWDDVRKKWRAEARFLNKSGTYLIGRFNDRREAADAYDQAVFEKCGTRARLNFCSILLRAANAKS